jgi:hypothetical protein
MLSTLTPFAERARGHAYGLTAAFYVVGAVFGGLSLGVGLAAAGLLVKWTAPGEHRVLALAAVCAIVTIASDLRLMPVSLPVHPRQVNEGWLTHYRPWVYATGFGWQIGSGFTTYVMTAATYLMAALDVLTGDVVATIALGAAFGALRGLALLAGVGQVNPSATHRFHTRFDAWEPWSRKLAVAGQLAVVVLAAEQLGRSAAGVTVGVLFVVLFSSWGMRRLASAPRRSRSTVVTVVTVEGYT